MKTATKLLKPKNIKKLRNYFDEIQNNIIKIQKNIELPYQVTNKSYKLRGNMEFVEAKYL